MRMGGGSPVHPSLELDVEGRMMPFDFDERMVCLDRGEDVALPGRLDWTVSALLALRDLDDFLETCPSAYETAVMRCVAETVASAFEQDCPHAALRIQKALFLLYEDSVGTPRPGLGQNQNHPFIALVRYTLERAWERSLLSRLQNPGGNGIPDDADFSDAFQERCREHRVTLHPLFDFLAYEAPRQALLDYFLLESLLVGRFCDLVVLSMLGIDDQVKQEVAENLWDEVGNGNYRERHCALFQRLLDYAGLSSDAHPSNADGRADRLGEPGLAGYNLYLFLLLNRRHYFKSVGCMAVGEFIVPPQYEKVAIGCRRVGLSDESALAYYTGHVEADAEHAEGWINNVMLPLIRQYPETKRDMVIGADLCLDATARYFDFVLDHLRSVCEGNADTTATYEVAA